MKPFASVFCAVMSGSLVFGGCGGGGGEPDVDSLDHASLPADFCQRSDYGAIVGGNRIVQFDTRAQYEAHIAAGHPCDVVLIGNVIVRDRS